MAHKSAPPSKPPRTYSAQAPIAGALLTCRRCARSYPYPKSGSKPIRCECGWWYKNVDGTIREEFKPRIGA